MCSSVKGYHIPILCFFACGLCLLALCWLLVACGLSSSVWRLEIQEPRLKLPRTHYIVVSGSKGIDSVSRLEDITELEGSIWSALPALELPFRVEG